MMTKGLFISFFLLIFVSVNAQISEPKHTFNIELGLPNSFTNKPFKSIMQGLVSLEPYYQYAFKNHLIVGGGLKYSYFAVNEFKVPKKVYGGMHCGGVFAKVGWEKFHSDHFATDVSIKMGYTQNYFVTDLNDSIAGGPIQINAAYLEPCVGLILTADEFSSYRLVIGYSFQGFAFRPDMIGLESFGEYEPKELSPVSTALIIGFGYTHYFKPKK
jgi:hypothetical protein